MQEEFQIGKVDPDQAEIEGYVSSIIFRNEGNGYTVLTLSVDPDSLSGLPAALDALDGEDEITCVGNFPSVSQGESLTVRGIFTDHPSYGTQFRMTSYEASVPKDEESIRRYLGSGAIKGVGPALAARIVKKFGRRTIQVMEEEPERLAEVRGISQNKAVKISDQMVEKRDLGVTMRYLGQYGIEGALALRLFDRYGLGVKKVLEENPYRLAEEVKGIGFRTADQIAARLGIATDSAYRIRCGVLYILHMAAGEGHTFLPKENLRQDLTDLLGMEVEGLEALLLDLAGEKKIRLSEGEEVYLYHYYELEEETAFLLLKLDEKKVEAGAGEEERIQKACSDADRRLDARQIEAVAKAARRGVFILTGGPGTGKTTTIRAMISFFQKEGEDILLAAPTGRAAKRMSEATGFEARTIHRMLEVRGGGDQEEEEGPSHFERNQDNPLDADVIIIDEMSMVDISLFHALLLAVPEEASLILVGDVDQLPSVGPGNVLKDLIGSGAFSVVRLERIFRQARESDIVMNAHRINRGEEVRLDNKSRDFFFMKRPDAGHIIKVMLLLVQKNLPAYLHIRPEDIQVLSPMRKGKLGVENLNRVFQKYLNPPAGEKAEYLSGSRIFRVGDKVMQTKNDYQLAWEKRNEAGVVIETGDGVFNGDMGVIREIDLYSSRLIVEYDEMRTVSYPLKDLSELDLAYAVTVHKSQGSEYPAVLMPMLPGPRPLMTRNILYTAVTRAKQCVVLIGDPKVFFHMEENVSEARRYTGLEDRIIETGQRLALLSQ